MRQRFIACFLVIVLGLSFAGCGKKPGKIMFSVSTKSGVSVFDIKDESIVSAESAGGSYQKNTMTDTKTGKTIQYEINEVCYELTAKKSGKTKLTVEYINYKNDEPVKDVYDIEVDKDLQITITKHDA